MSRGQKGVEAKFFVVFCYIVLPSSWLNQFPGLIHIVCKKIAKIIPGWQDKCNKQLWVFILILEISIYLTVYVYFEFV